ncbi:MAG: hypothetical protein ACSLE4_02660 [Methyloceanibacter sp.]|uniref:hypothetical protein n=1 Tax=Methyloceanibacter sp. TaxID=1965321 RepID=UPI003EE0B3A8
MIDPSDTITTEEELRTIYAQPGKPVDAHLADRRHRSSTSQFEDMIGTADARGGFFSRQFG